MKMVKSLLLGTAAGLVAMTGAQAADLPVKAKPVQYVKICSLYGAGFYYMPGTDTCLKIGGFVRTELNFNAGGSFNPYHVQNLDAPTKNFTLWRSRAVLTADARSQTEYGTLRSYLAFGVNWDNGVGSGASSLNAYRGFIQWAGFTAGRAQSFFDFYSTPAYSNTTNVWASDTGGTGINLLAYTAQFGNGFSASLSIEDGAHRRICGGGGVTSCTAGIFGTPGYAGVTWPDFAANLRIDQSWGSAQIMGAIHYIEALGPGGLQTTDELGWAVGAGLTINLPMIGRGDTLSAQITYAEGAMHYVGSGITTPGFAIAKGFPAITEFGFGPGFDATFIGGGNIDLTTGWSVVAGFQHNWNPKWKTSLYGTYGELDYSAAAIAASGGILGDWSMWQIGSRTVWTPVTNLDLSVDIMYNNIDGVNFAGVDTNVGWLQGMVRAQRNFYP